MNQKLLFGHQIDAYLEEMLQDLEKLIAIPSVCEENSPDGPFGKPCKDALSFILNRARELGLDTENVENYAGHASYGSKEECIDILTHLDVVPAGEGWDSDPFTAVRKGNRLYGRGTADDKGAAIAALYCLKALKDANITGSRRIRAVFGCGEEIGSDDLTVYYAKEGLPIMGFTPDCSYGICYAEKGILHLELSARRSDSSAISRFLAGTAVNAVPGTARAWLCLNPQKRKQLSELTKDLSHITLKDQGELFEICCQGKAAHGAEPELGVNAASTLIRLLYQVLSPEELGPLFTFAAEKIALEYDGASLRIQMSDEPSGPLTLNLGLVSAEDGQETLSLDIRYPVTAHKDRILSSLSQAAVPYDIAITETSHMEPLYIPKDAPMIGLLKDSYEAATGKACTLFSTGGGTYARHCGNRVAAFGPIFPEEPPSNAHGPNEFIDLTYFRMHCRICLEALYRMLVQ